MLYTKTCALLNGLVVGLIAGLLSGQELGWMVLAGFLGMEVFVLVRSVMQGLVLWRKKSLQGVWVLECCNVVPHHLGQSLFVAASNGVMMCLAFASLCDGYVGLLRAISSRVKFAKRVISSPKQKHQATFNQ